MLASRRLSSPSSSSLFLPSSRLLLSPYSSDTPNQKDKSSLPWEKSYISGVGFPDWIEKWNRTRFYQTGAGLTAANIAVLGALGPTSIIAWTLAVPTGLYWTIGLKDIKQTKHAVRHNFPVLGNFRYLFESVRPEIQQYFIEEDHEGKPFSRLSRGLVYARAKNMVDTVPFGTKRDVYDTGFEWINHSLFPVHVPPENSRILVGGPACKQPYSAALLNVSGMSYGALSDNAILALNTAAQRGNFYHNTGEGGISEFHNRPNGDLVWNIGTGYFGCRNAEGNFDADLFKQNATRPNVKMIELKLSQGAKPSHGGMLPKAKITPEIAAARHIPMDEDCLSPATHSAFKCPREMMEFLASLRELSGGKPVGFKLCVGSPVELASLIHAMLDTKFVPDFITVDGAEGGTGAAPAEYINSVGMPLHEGLHFVNGLLEGAGIRDQVKLIAAGKVTSGFSIVRLLALGADLTNAARAMMFSLGCIQALKCNTNTCPTGIATQDKNLMRGLDVADKAHRVANFQAKTVASALELVGTLGLTHPSQVKPGHITKRFSSTKVMTYRMKYPKVEPGSLLLGEGPEEMQNVFNKGGIMYQELCPKK